MLTEVILEGPLGKQFGREWKLSVSTPAEALRLINANKPGIFTWIRGNLREYPAYKVICKYNNDVVEQVDELQFSMQGKLKRVTFVPVVEGSGGGFGKIIMGAAMITAAYFMVTTGTYAFAAPAIASIGATMVMSGIAQLLTPVKNPNVTASYNFNGPVNTTRQGVPVQLIYGQCLVGSQVISAALVADQIPVPQ